jgi:hypothetical protein
VAYFGAGVLLAALAILAAWKFYPQLWPSRDSPALAAAWQHHEARRAAAQEEEPAAAAVAQRAPAGGVPRDCSFDPVLASAGPRDGRYAVRAALAVQRSGDPAPFLDVASEAAGQQRMRDGEVALIVACRLAARETGSPTVLLGDIQARLADHYTTAAGMAPAWGIPDVWSRARSLVAASVDSYVAALGPQASKTRRAQARLAAFAEPAAQAQEGQDGTAAPAPSRATVFVADPPAAAADAELQASARPEEARAREASARGHEPAQASLPVPQLVRQDPELQQLESDLRRLRAQAEAVSDDPAGLRRRSAQARAERDARCRDKACLRAWYAQRRSALLAEF